ncbi:MAG: histidine kinase [Actinomycetota bacterium]|nr:histidine kinase [Actinomycetota bacterium]
MTLDERQLRGLARIVLVIVVIGSVATIAMEIAAGRADEAVFSILLLSFPAVGFFVLSRRPDARLAWLMVSMGVANAILDPIQGYGVYAVEHDLPSGPLALAIAGPGWVPFVGVSGFLLLLFPDGHLPSPRWRWFAWLCGVSLTLVFIWIWFYPGDFGDSGYPDVQNPIGIETLRPILDFLGVFLLAAPLLVVGGFVSLVVRMRSTTDDVLRHQIRWLAYAASVMALFFLLSWLPGLGNDEGWGGAIQTIGAMSFMLIPVATGLAILRYRLYDIDVVIRKTLVIAVVVGFIALVYVAVVAGVGAVVGASSNAPLLSALAAAIVALVFQPVRARARRFADRIVYGKRATPYEVVATFGDQLAGTYAADDVLPRTARVLGEGVGAARAEVRMAIGDEMRSVASWPVDAPHAPDDFVAEVRHQGEVLGELAIAMPANDPLDGTREQLVQDLAAQAGLVLRNERLAGQLRARLADLQAAQKRLVAAQDEERRRLERNIHDGAQQQLVALQVRQRLAEQIVDRDPGKAKEMLAALQVDTASALEDLRDLARGIYPPLLADKGLGAALEAQARKSTVPVAVETGGVGRLSQDIEAAVYFSVLEALQNVAKYAQARSATVRISIGGGELTFEVRDDGLGFDPSSTGYGSGLQGIADRLGAIDGRLSVDSEPGRGATLAGRIPMPGRVDDHEAPGVPRVSV